MKMVRRSRKRHVPANAFERAVRMAIERGRLADLMFAEGASKSSYFMNRVVSALTSLPGAQRALASEQVKSRFLKVALGRRARI